MLKFFKKEKTVPVDELMDDVLDEMRHVGVSSEKYPELMTYLERLHMLKVKEHREPVSRDTLAIVIGNLLGILIIVAYEQKHIFASRGFSQLLRPRTD